MDLINGVGAAASIEQLSSFVNFQDPDARYNSIVSNLPFNGLGDINQGAWPAYYLWPGADHFNLTFANSTTTQIPLLAAVPVEFANITSGEQLFEQACLPSNTSSSSSSSSSSLPSSSSSLPSSSPSSSSSVAPPLPPPEHYPVPVVRDPYNLIVGYFLDDPLLADVAVLSVPTFETADTAPNGGNLPNTSVADFATAAQDFVDTARAAGKTKIIIDVSGNPGGEVVSGYGLLSIFFPDETIYSATRFRTHPAIELMAQIFNAGNASSGDEVTGTPLSLPQVAPAQITPITTVQELIGPYYVLGTPSSALVAEFNWTQAANPSQPIDIDGQGGPLNETMQPFATEDIIIVSGHRSIYLYMHIFSEGLSINSEQVTDGQCSSTCGIFANHMIGRGVRVVAFGGRPQPGPMQAIGGVKGSEVLELSDIDQYVAAAQEVVAGFSQAGTPLLNATEMARFNAVMPIPLSDFPLQLSQGSVNFLNAYAPDNDVVPTQFVYEAAYCRLFYTAASVAAPEQYWASAANAIWGNGTCAYQLPSSIGEQAISLPPPAAASTNTKPSRTALGMLLALAQGINQS